jgi:hypothetical protein
MTICLKILMNNRPKQIFREHGGQLRMSEAIKNGIIKKKQLMTKTCLKCHRDNKKAGKAYGPVKCSGCHIK